MAASDKKTGRNNKKPALLLTGATGFIGNAIIPYINDTYDIITLGRHPALGLPVITADLSDSSGPITADGEITAIETVIHAAALTRKTAEDKTMPADYFRTNVGGTVRILDLLEHEAEKLNYFLYVSTCDVYAPSAGKITETSPVSPQNPYAESKLEAENIVKTWCEDHKIHWAIVRLGTIYGPHEETYGKFIPVAIQTALGMKPISIKGSGHALRDVLYRDDAARSVAHVVRSRGLGLYSSVSGRAVSVKSIAEKINRIAGNKKGLSFDAPDFPETNRIFDNAKIRSLGWKPETGLSEGLAAEIDWFRTKMDNS